MIEIVAARPQHVGIIANRAREIDRRECAMAGHTVKEALRYGLMYGQIAWTAKVDGRPEAMFGAVCGSMLEGRARVWMIMTNEATAHRTALLRFGRIYTEALHRHFTVLENHVSADNDLAIRWLTRLGFVVGPVDVIRGQPVRPFYRVAGSQHV